MCYVHALSLVKLAQFFVGVLPITDIPSLRYLVRPHAMAVEESVYLAKLAEQAERYEGVP